MALDTVDFGAEEQAMQAYFREGEARAQALGNRGPLRFTTDGKLRPDIVEGYGRCGFYVLEGVVSERELGELEAAYLELPDMLPTGPESKVDSKGRPSLGHYREDYVCLWSKPLGDPFGGTSIGKGRHEVKMFEPNAAADKPEQVPLLITSPIQHSQAALRLLGHPQLLALVAALNGDDFVPLAEAIIMKRPGEGPSFAWHQDGVSQGEDRDPQGNGFQSMAQLYGSTAANGVWYLPGSHTWGKVDLKGMSLEAGSDRLPGAVPLICGRGDVAISNRQVAHGSFANTNGDLRVTFNMGFHRRSRLLGAVGAKFNTSEKAVVDEEALRKRCETIGHAIAARRDHFPDETAFVYKPHVSAGEVYHWDEHGLDALRNYNKDDIVV